MQREQTVSIQHVPYQYLSRLVVNLCMRARTRANRGTKQLNTALHEIDKAAMDRVAALRTAEVTSKVRVIVA